MSAPIDHAKVVKLHPRSAAAEREKLIRAEVARLKRLIAPAEAFRAIALARVDNNDAWPLVRALLQALAVRPRLPRRLIDAHAERLREALK